ncbi:MAG: phage holin family protein [Patescibacteria group bacterium]|nr:phage holin family protein [Patescibacteria group bacterium]
MFRSLLRHFGISILALYLTSQFLVKGFIIPLNLLIYLKIALVFSLLTYLVKPFLKIIFLPLNFITLGLFFWFLNVIILYLLKLILAEVSFIATPYPSFSYYGIIIPSFRLSAFWSLVLSSISLTVITKLINWLMKK